MDTPFLAALRVCRRHGAGRPDKNAVGFAAAAACAAMGTKRCFLDAEGAAPASAEFLADLAGALSADVWAGPQNYPAVALRGSRASVQTLFAAAREIEAAAGFRSLESNYLLGAAFGYFAPGAFGFGPIVVWVAAHEGTRGVMWYEGLSPDLPPDGPEVDLRRHAHELAAAPATVEAVVVRGPGELEATLGGFRR